MQKMTSVSEDKTVLHPWAYSEDGGDTFLGDVGKFIQTTKQRVLVFRYRRRMERVQFRFCIILTECSKPTVVIID